MLLDAARQTLAQYEILEKVGEGGMGVVYKARDARLARLVALKFLSADSPQARDRALDEARAIAALNHPNIATIYEIRDSGCAPVLVLEYLAGETLRPRIAAGPFSLADIVKYGIQIAEALEYAHEHGLVHGDVKPENLMFTEDGRIKITDFGLSRPCDNRTATVDGKISGTILYMAPECLHGWPADCRTDIFSLGVVLGEMAGEQAMPEAFRSLIARANGRERSKRFQTMQEVAVALRQLNVAAEPPACETPTILVIEDDDGLRSALELGLLNEGYRVIKAGNGREAIRLVAEEAPQVVLLDVMLPGLNGFDVRSEEHTS